MSHPALPKVGVVLVNWNGGDLTACCIESLLAMTVMPWRIVVFDNASTDGSPDLIASRFPDVLLMRREANVGFTGANNAGIQCLVELGADYIWVLNNDTTVERDCLEQFMRLDGSIDRLGAFGAKILHADPPNTIWYAGARLNPLTFRAPHDGVGRPRSSGEVQPCEVDFVTGCSMLIPRRAIEQVGLFDHRYFAYNEDFDWCLRAKRHGLKLVYAPQAVVYHRVSASLTRNALGRAGGTAAPLAYYLTTRNFLWTVRKHGSPLQVLTATTIRFVQLLAVSAGMLSLGRFEKLSAVWRGVRDGLGGQD